jgi:glycosyltransferase involved in cell wall biosynthesis
MAASDLLPARPTVSVIVPARDEELCLGSCLESLTTQTGVAYEILVVDDHSIDRTREIAQSFPSVRIIEAGALPQGWTGKNNAVVAGAREAKGDWLLFTDADTVHLPGSLARALAEAAAKNADLLSYSPKQIVEGFWEKAVMPVIFAELASTYSPSKVSDPRSSAAAANGQYILIKRDAYDAVGGHAAVAGNLLEDVALARAMKQSGRKIVFRFGDDQVRTRMYRSFTQLREGWSKNLVLLFPWPRRLALLRLMEFVLIGLSLAVSVRSFVRGTWLPAVAGIILGLILCVLFFRRVRKAHFAWDTNSLAFLGLPLFSYLLWRSKLSHDRGKVSWRGRTYSGSPLDIMPIPPAQEKVQEKRDLSHAQS